MQPYHKLDTFSAASPVTNQGVISCLDISPDTKSFGFNMQRVATTTTEFDESAPGQVEPFSGDGQSKLIERIDRHMLGQNSRDLSIKDQDR